MDILAKNLMILASAGSGKTFQLGNRVIGLVASGIEPEKIVALTFTRKAAGEFADSVLIKLASAAAEPETAASLRSTLSLPDADFADSLERVVRALPSFTLGTMDSFFAKIVRAFQYELGLTGGKFDLLEGPRAAAIADEMLAGLVGDGLASDLQEPFFHAFRRATIGREDQGVLKALRQFVKEWHERYRESADLEWGPALTDLAPEEWEKQKAALTRIALGVMDSFTESDKRQPAAMQKAVEHLGNHVIGSGSLGSGAPGLVNSIIEAVATTPSGPLELRFYKPFTIGGSLADTLREMVRLAAGCEFASALQRTRAVREVVAVFDDLSARRLRANGLLGFSDVKLLMGEWACHEDARLRREAVDFRLDARIDHWLLDEFQDTSRADWTGLLPLVDEAATDDEGSLFIVGDRKQAIYAWRGGDVSLFDEVMARYSGGLETAPMDESWRSCPEVLALVNRVCGDRPALESLFGEAADRWPWRDHEPAAPLREPSFRGHAKVEVVGSWDDRLDHLEHTLHELQIGKRAITCGILLRGNEKAREVADFLRTRNFDVIEEGRREPARDNPVGVFISHLLQWLANPADRYAREVVEMSPFAPSLVESRGPSWPAVWSSLNDEISRRGFAETIADLIARQLAGWSDFGRRRAGDVLSALAELDARGTASAREAADWLERFEVSQSPGVAAVQVMTIHKSKGLGFDVVILPEIPDKAVPQSQHFTVAEGPGWLTQTPPKWARSCIPELQVAEESWAASQQYEALCTLYVALTRAKRGLYVMLDTPAKKADPERPTLSNWLATAIESDGETGIAFEAGSRDWIESLPELATESAPEAPPALGKAVPRRDKSTPSGAKSSFAATAHSATGMEFGNAVHALFERVSWTDEAAPRLPDNAAGKAVARVLDEAETAPLFRRNGNTVELFREQATDAILDGKHLSGIIDRLHLHRDPDGTVRRVEIIDFKTDAVEDPAELATRYTAQMHAYREVMSRIHPDAELSCSLLSVRHACLVAV